MVLLAMWGQLPLRHRLTDPALIAHARTKVQRTIAICKTPVRE